MRCQYIFFIFYGLLCLYPLFSHLTFHFGKGTPGHENISFPDALIRKSYFHVLANAFPAAMAARQWKVLPLFNDLHCFFNDIAVHFFFHFFLVYKIVIKFIRYVIEILRYLDLQIIIIRFKAVVNIDFFAHGKTS